MTLEEFKIIKGIKTYSELFEKLGIKDTSNPSKLVHNWIKGKSIPSQKNMEQIIQATSGKVTPNDFFDMSKIDQKNGRIR